MDIGEKIKNLRLRIGLTQAELAERSDLTKGFISQLEHDLTSPSIDTLENIVGALGMTMASFFEESDKEPTVFHFKDAFLAENEELNSVMHWIIPTAQRREMEPVILDLAAGGSTKEYDPFEGEIFGYVLSGSPTLVLGEQKLHLKKADSFYFDATDPFYIENKKNGSAKILWVATPPSF